jgi:hypothetical protein
MNARSIASVVLTLLFLPVVSVADAQIPDEKLSKELVGTWKVVSSKFGGRDSDLPKRLNILKHITPTHMTWMRADPKSGEVVAMACGKWRLKGDQFSETPEFGMGRDFGVVKGGTHTFTCRVVGDRWYHTGKLDSGLTIEEVWVRQHASSKDESTKAAP